MPRRRAGTRADRERSIRGAYLEARAARTAGRTSAGEACSGEAVGGAERARRAGSGEQLPGTILGVRLGGRRAREQADRFADDAPTRNRMMSAGGRNGRGTATRGRRIPLFAVVALSVLVMTACGRRAAGDAKAGQKAGGQESAPAAETTASAGPQGDRQEKAGARAGEAVARADGGTAARAEKAEAGTGKAGARVGEARADAGSVAIAGSRGGAGGSAGGEGGPREVTLKITGERGTGFSGACSVGGKERTLDGRVPDRYVFEPRGKRLECELRTDGVGALGIRLADGAGVRSEQRTAGGERTLRFTYSNGSISSSTSSVSEGRSVTYSGGSSSEGSP